MNWTLWMAVAIVCLTVWALIRRYETRLVLLASGLLMALISLDPMMAFRQFDKSMTNASLIIAICSAMGFAGVISVTKCDVHLVRLLTAPLKRLGLLLLPACMVVTSIIATAIPSMAGLSASVAPTMIPILVRAGFRPSMAAASVGACMLPAYFNPGVSHNPFIAKLASIEVMDFIGAHGMMTLGLSIASIVLMTFVCVCYGDFRREGFGEFKAEEGAGLPERANILFAIAPLIGMIYALAVTRSNPQEISKKFFDGMGKGYASIMGIIIAAGVFAAGLRAAGVIDLFVDFLKNSNEIAKIGGSVGPFILGVLTGSGDAAAFAFNEAVTPHAPSFGLTIDGLGYLAMISAGLGRMASPLAGGIIVLAGVAGVSPMEIVKRTAPAAVVMLAGLYLFTV